MVISKENENIPLDVKKTFPSCSKRLKLDKRMLQAQAPLLDKIASLVLKSH